MKIFALMAIFVMASIVPSFATILTGGDEFPIIPDKVVNQKFATERKTFDSIIVRFSVSMIDDNFFSLKDYNFLCRMADDYLSFLRPQLTSVILMDESDELSRSTHELCQTLSLFNNLRNKCQNVDQYDLFFFLVVKTFKSYIKPWTKKDLEKVAWTYPQYKS